MTAASPLTNVQARDAEALLHPYTPLHRLKEIGPLVIQRAKGIYVYDTQGKPYIEAWRACGARVSAMATKR